MNALTAPRFVLAGLAGAALILLTAGGSAADELKVWGKPAVKGKVLSEAGGVVKFKTDSGEVIEVERSMIQKLTTDAEAEAAKEAETKKDEPEPEPEPATTTGPLIPTKRKPAGGWLMKVTKNNQVIGFRAVEVKRQGTGFVMEQQEFQLDPSGRPQFLALATMTFGPEMQCLGSASRVLAKGRSRNGQDDTQRLRMGGGKVSLELQDRGAASTKAPEYDVPSRTIFRGAELALLLHGKLAMDFVHGKEVEPMHIPLEYALQNGGKGPEGKPIPTTITLAFELVGKHPAEHEHLAQDASTRRPTNTSSTSGGITAATISRLRSLRMSVCARGLPISDEPAGTVISFGQKV